MRWPIVIATKPTRAIRDAVKRFFEGECPQQAVGIAYWVLF